MEEDLIVDDDKLMKSRTYAENTYANPGPVLGSATQIERSVQTFDFATNKIVNKTVTIPMVPEQIFLEFTANIIDEYNHITAHYPPEKIHPIEITVDRHRITVKNQWLPRQGNKELEISKGKQTGLWVPQRAFGTFFNSGHYDDKKNTNIGRHGIGVKGANLFSAQLFCVLVDLVLRMRQYCQSWENNMQRVSEPVITPISGNPEDSFVLISYVLEFARFGMTQYPDEFFGMVAKHCHDMAMVTGVPVKLLFGFNTSAHQSNNYPIPVSSPEDALAKGLYLMNISHPTKLTYAKLIGFDKDREFKHTTIVMRREEDQKKPSLEFILMDTPDDSKIISFANGINTREHGQYIYDLQDEVARLFVEVMKEKVAKIEQKRVTALLKTGDTKRVNFPLTVKDVKGHLSYLICINGSDVEFDSQIKIRLVGPAFPFKGKLDEDEIKKLVSAKWKIFEKLLSVYESKTEKSTEKKKSKKISAKVMEANFAKTRRGEPCLFLCEGDSAANYLDSLFGILGNDNFGAFPLRGKLLNAMKADVFQINTNEEFIAIANAIGLETGVDYRIDQNYRNLRYKYVTIITDADTDGLHIAGLILLYFYILYPTFLQRNGVVMWWRTPRMRVWKGDKYLLIYSQNDEDRWKNQNPDWESWGFKYYKGLGTSSKANVIEDAKIRRVVTYFYDDNAPDSFKCSFHKDYSDERKKWIDEWLPNFEVEEMMIQPISLFLKHIFGEYNCANVGRSIPCYLDGFKPSQRKILHTVFNIWGDRRQKKVKEMRVCDLASSASILTKYHHGNTSLSGAIIGMALDYVGTNNLPLLVPASVGFGSRVHGVKKHAADRYLFTNPQSYLPYIFRPEDIPILTYLKEEGEKIEPAFYLPIICPIYNGQLGIATGHSTFVPNYHPRHCIEWHRCKLLGKPLPTMIPYYHGFRGTIKFVSSLSPSGGDKEGEKVKEVSLESLSPSLEGGEDPSSLSPEGDKEEKEEKLATLDDIKEDETASNRIIITGIFEDRGDDATVTELPVGVWTNNYKLWLEKLKNPGSDVGKKKKKQAKNKKEEGNAKDELKESLKPKIRDYTYQIDDVATTFHIQGLEFKATTKSLKLDKHYSLNNMVLLNTKGKPLKFPNIAALLETFHQERLPFYQLRKNHLLVELQENYKVYVEKMSFITAILTGQLVIFTPGSHRRRPREEIEADMMKLGLPVKLLTSTSLDRLTEQAVTKLWNEAEKARAEYEELLKTTPETLWLRDLEELEKHLPY